MRKVLLILALCTISLPGILVSQSQVAASASTAGPNPEIAGKLLGVKRIYIDSFGEDPASRQLQALLIDSLTATKRFIITENKEKADAIIKGVGTEQSNHEFHSTKEGTAVGNARGGAGISDASASTETINQARLTVRLVSADGDVIWSTEKESKGAKYKGASADVADEVAKQLLRDIDRLSK